MSEKTGITRRPTANVSIRCKTQAELLRREDRAFRNPDTGLATLARERPHPAGPTNVMVTV